MKMRNSVQDENGQIVIFLVFLLAVLLAFMGGIISVGNKSLRNLRMQNAADAAALAGTACLARGLNSMANLTATKFEEETGGDLIYPFEFNEQLARTGALTKVNLLTISGGSLTDHKDQYLHFNPLSNHNELDSRGNIVINEGQPDARKAEILKDAVVKGLVIEEHLDLIKNAIDKTKEEYIGTDFDAKIGETSTKFALENGYEIYNLFPIGPNTWQPEWSDPNDPENMIDITYNYWLEYRSKETHPCTRRSFSCYNYCEPCGFTCTTERCGSRLRPKTRYHCYCKKCWVKKTEVSPIKRPFWVGAELRSTQLNISVQSATGTIRESIGEVANIYSGSNPDGGQIFPPQPNFEIQLSD